MSEEYTLKNAVSNATRTVNLFANKAMSIGQKILVIVTRLQSTDLGRIDVANCTYKLIQNASNGVDRYRLYGCTYIVTITGNNPVFNYSFGSYSKGTEATKQIQALICNLGYGNITGTAYND